MLATIPKETVVEILGLVRETLASNVVTTKALRSLAGKAMNIASLLIVWRPFIAQFWAALSHDQPKAPQNTIRVKQILHSLCWLQLFPTETCGTISRTYLWSRYYENHRSIVITTDASPFGIGGWIAIDGVVLEYYSDDICECDCLVLQRQRGSHEGQQAFESLALLVAFRQWLHFISHCRSAVHFRGDNTGALTVLSALKGKGSLGIVARELALDRGQGEFMPTSVSHLPGVANDTADALSRRLDPSKQPWRLPAILHHAVLAQTATRNAAWWRVKTLEDSFSGSGGASAGDIGNRAP